MNLGSDREVRMAGLFMVVMGGVFIYWQIYLPISQAFASAPDIHYYPEAAAFAPFFVCLGLMALIFGRQGQEYINLRASTPVKVLLVLFMLGMVFGCFLGMKFILKGLGYS